MKITCMIVLAALCTAVSAQIRWKHQILVSGAQPPFGSAFINSHGTPVFSVNGRVYKGSVEYGDPHQDGLAGGINDAGQMLWRSNGHLYVDHDDISAGIVVDGDNHWVTPLGISAAGVPFWSENWGSPSQNQVELFVGTKNLGLSTLLGSPRSVSAGLDWIHMNRSGDVIWTGGGPATNSTGKAFKNTTNITDPVLGPQAFGDARAINDAGQVAWRGGVQKGGPYHAFVDGDDVTADVLGSAALLGFSRDINNRGQLLWEGRTAAYQSHVFLDGADLTAMAYGATAATGTGVRISNSGHALWYGWANGVGRIDTFVDGRNLSATVLGTNRTNTYPYGIDEAGHALWSGGGDNFPHNQVFVDTFPLSYDALGTTALFSDALAIGPNGHVLWFSKDLTTGEYTYWLSTPVPEPNVTVAGLFVLAGAAARALVQHRPARR